VSASQPSLFGGEVAQPLVNLIFGSGQVSQPIELTPKKNGKIVVIGQSILINTNTRVTLETEDGTDYQVPTGKTFTLVQANMTARAVLSAVFGFGDDGVAEGTTTPTNAVFFPWTQTQSIGVSILTVTTAQVNQEFRLAGSIPAEKFPFMGNNVTANFTMAMQIIGVEHDA